MRVIIKAVELISDSRKITTITEEESPVLKVRTECLTRLHVVYLGSGSILELGDGEARQLIERLRISVSSLEHAAEVIEHIAGHEQQTQRNNDNE